MRRIALLLMLVLSISACKFSAKDIPGLLSFYEQPENYQVLPKEWEPYKAKNTPEAQTLLSKLVAFSENKGIAVVEEPLDQTLGYSHFIVGYIALNSGMGADAKLGTLAHELGHFCSVHLNDAIMTDRLAMEVVAESIALVSLTETGRTGEFLAPYSIAWLLNIPRAIVPVRTKALRDYASIINECAEEIKTALR